MIVSPEDLAKYVEVLKGSGVKRVRMGELEIEFATTAPSVEKMKSVEELLDEQGDEQGDDGDWDFAATEGYPRPRKSDS